MYIIQQKGNEDTQTYQEEFITLIYHQILVNNLQGNARQLEGRIYFQILELKGLKERKEGLCYWWGIQHCSAWITILSLRADKRIAEIDLSNVYNYIFEKKNCHADKPSYHNEIFISLFKDLNGAVCLLGRVKIDW